MSIREGLGMISAGEEVKSGMTACSRGRPAAWHARVAWHACRATAEMGIRRREACAQHVEAARGPGGGETAAGAQTAAPAMWGGAPAFQPREKEEKQWVDLFVITDKSKG